MSNIYSDLLFSYKLFYFVVYLFELLELINFHSGSVTLYPWYISPLVNIMLLNKEYAKTSVYYM